MRVEVPAEAEGTVGMGVDVPAESRKVWFHVCPVPAECKMSVDMKVHVPVETRGLVGL